MASLQIEDIVVGDGQRALAGRDVTVHYVGSLEDGSQFDSSIGGEPFESTLGSGKVIAGWDQGLAGMRVGGKRKLTISSELAYGDRGIPGVIPAGATLLFEVELLEVR